MPTPTILPDRGFSPLNSPLDPYLDAYPTAVDEPDFGLTSRTLMLKLPAIALATLDLHAAPAKTWMPETRGRITETSIRLAIWKDRGHNLSGYAMALNLQYVYYGGTGERGGNVPLLGLDLLRCVDELGCEATELRCSMPSLADPFTFETVRLKTALARIATVEPSRSTTRKR